MTALLLLRVASLVLWGGLAALLMPSALRSLRGGTTTHDHYRSGFAFVGLLFAGYNLRWFVAADDEATRLALQALSLLLAFYIFRLCRAYGAHRG